MGGCATQLEAAEKINLAADFKGKNVLSCGATAGIGEGIAIRLAKGGANVTIVGRSVDAGTKIVEGLKTINPQGRFEFVQSDLSLLQNCRKLCTDYVNSHDRLDFVIFTQTKPSFNGKTPTPVEKIDEKLCLHFYSRIFMTNLLLPLLRKTAVEQNSDVRVLSVLAAGVHPSYEGWKTDTRLSEKNYTTKLAADCGTFYNDLCLDKLAKENKEITLIHVNPGFVDSQWGKEFGFAIRGPIRLLQAVAGRSVEDCAEFMVRALVERKNSAEKPGVNLCLCNEYGEATACKTSLHTDEAMNWVWNDTMNLFNEAEKRVVEFAESKKEKSENQKQ